MTRVRTIVAPVLFGVAALAAWQLAVVALGIRPFVLPSPFAIGEQFARNAGVVTDAAGVTAGNALVGLVLGVAVAVVFAMLSATLRVVDQVSAPLVVAASVVPIVALAPVLYTMFGASVETARQLVAALAVFIPVYVNSLRGLRTVRPIHRDLMRAYAASGWQATRTVTLPGALPFFFTGVRIASSLAVISALIAEYFGGPVGGLGKSITSAVASSNYPLAWAFVLGAILTGLVFYCVTLALETVATRHRTSG
ncbi:NitT/TauT family transport system permease protein [Diaminobutyricimonas aerilata]|uniref:NitT/TauT family transport system permease protein n=1 Tax=Diaminobutyricimonas aerilata TaxID=1162967 RepID=A0A2M9CIM4_9MICO|nr:ABC transporter permease subunit [Diaminobutyricimonas aerilata]PJJ71719.1 NitT/TauT family transport system permease protein [Diaminobutyricimonas aerilata]